ncbi:TPX2 domain-containing protein [Heracleum sosnowskyi]|uniref:TPX2 domain-containing protein n=1 Tax=Heracleum sosnowskyi TaxID=360622 RepID=A0AAD8M2E7_9APIA|nr:TPX2 domain-containing protein [Heracleum sosnowskyi]
MGDSACFMPPAFSYTSGVPNEPYQGNPVNVLGESVSFGRFMTESLAWEKWSSFSNKRHVEEAERYAQPGSVAQKKAFFEAHYKRIAAAKKAAALLEQQNAASNALEQTEIETQELGDCNIANQDSETIKQDSQEMVLEKNQEIVVSTDGVDVNAKRHKSEPDRLDCADLDLEPQVLIEICPNVDKQNMVSGLKNDGTPKIAKSSVKKNNTDQKDVSKSVSKKKPVFSSLRSSVFSKVASSPAKFVAPPLPRKEINILTPRTIKSKMNFTDMKRSTPKPHQKSINFTTPAERNTLSTLPIRKSENSRNLQNSYKATKDIATPLRTPITASASKKPKHPSVTPSSVNKSASCSKSFSACQKTLQSTTSSTPFLLRTELRAEKRKQRLEERFNEKETEKVQMQTKSKEKAEAEVWKLRQSLCFRARPLPEFYRERKTQEMQTQSPKVEGKSCGSKTEAKNPLTRSSVKNNTFKNVSKKNSQTPSRNLSLPAMTPRKIPSKKLSTDQQKQY